MATHTVEFKVSARKELSALPELVQDRILAATENLANNPRARGCLKLKIHDDVLIVLVIRVAHRKEAY